jgi:hypothetical protein
LRIDWHRLRLVEDADLWYSGGGATQRSGGFFGFSGRPSHGGRSLGTILEGSATYTTSPHWSINGYVGVMRGGDVVKRTFAGDRLMFAYLESVLTF